MTNRLNKKIRERIMLDQLLKLLDIVPESVEGAEKPDFIITVGGGQIGVELTDMFKTHDTSTHTPQAEESLENSVLRLAQQNYLDKSQGPVQVLIRFGTSKSIREINRRKVAKEIADIVSSSRRQLNDFEDCVWRPHEQENQLIGDVVSFIRVLRVDERIGTGFLPARAGWAASLTNERIQARVAAKENLLSEYRNKASVVWLAIVADQTRPSQLFNLERATISPDSIQSPFDRTFLMAYPSNRVIELG